MAFEPALSEAEGCRQSRTNSFEGAWL